MKSVLEVSVSVPKARVAKYLGIEMPSLEEKLARWGFAGITVECDAILVNDVGALSESIEAWISHKDEVLALTAEEIDHLPDQVSYNGLIICKRDYVTLRALEYVLQVPLIPIKNRDRDSAAFNARDGRVVELLIRNQNLRELPEIIGVFTELHHLDVRNNRITQSRSESPSTSSDPSASLSVG